MISIKRLQCVVQSTAHHAVSGLCEVHPHLAEACEDAGLQSIAINFLQPGFEPRLTTISNELKLSTGALREKFAELLDVENIEASGIQDAFAIFRFARGRWPSSCYIAVTINDGKKVDVAVDSIGRTAEILHLRS